MGSVGENAEMFKMKKKLFYQNFIFKLTPKSDRFEHKIFGSNATKATTLVVFWGFF